MQPESITLLELQKRITRAVKQRELEEVWIRCEITEYNAPNHIYIELTQTENNRMIAKQKATIWASNKNFILNKFQTGTGTPLQKDLDVLLCVSVKYSPLHGMSLEIIDIDPSFTVGKLQLKIQDIENQLIKKGVFDKNKSFQVPDYFEHVAVLTPKGSAGEGDFKKEADLLEEVKLCKFTYFNATMQGLQAEESMSSQIAAINIAHAEEQFDALIIIRGGGAVADLSWLNNFKSANYICHSKLPVLCGLGHDRDISILCKVANLNLGTPSKCINFITKSNIRNIELAKQSLLKLEASYQNKANLLSSNASATVGQIQTTYINKLNGYVDKQESLNTLIYRIFRNGTLVSKGAKIKAMRTLSNSYSDNVARVAINSQSQNDNLKRSFMVAVKHKSKRAAELKNTLDNLMRQAPVKLLEKIFSLQLRGNQVSKQKTFTAKNYKVNRWDTLKNTFNLSIQRNSTLAIKDNINFKYKFVTGLKAIKAKAKSLHDNIFIMQPKRVLEKGYALIRNLNGKVMTKASQLEEHQEISIEFQDDKLNAKIGKKHVRK